MICSVWRLASALCAKFTVIGTLWLEVLYLCVCVCVRACMPVCVAYCSRVLLCMFDLPSVLILGGQCVVGWGPATCTVVSLVVLN